MLNEWGITGELFRNCGHDKSVDWAGRFSLKPHGQIAWQRIFTLVRGIDGGRVRTDGFGWENGIHGPVFYLLKSHYWCIVFARGTGWGKTNTGHILIN